VKGDQVTDVVGLYRKASDLFGEKVMSIKDDQWGDQTPCTEWDVRALVHHLVSENAWISPLLEGKAIHEVEDSLSGDLLGDDPKAAWSTAVEQSQAAVDQDGALDRTVHISRGDVPGGEYVFEVVADLAIHGWDLARAIGADETIDPSLMDAVYPYYESLISLMKSTGAYGPVIEPPGGADRQTTLLAMLGREAW
jgi:uncharacterized protein (TIGR03086 family)